MRNTPIETRLKLFEGNNDVVIKRDDAFIRQIEVLTLAGYPDRAVGFLEGIGLAYEALGKLPEARSFFTLSSGHELRRNTGYMAYYMGLSHLKLGNDSNAKEVFETMIAEANRQLERSTFSETGVIFGEREAENTRRSRSYTMRGLGYKGLGQMDQAVADLKQAVELSYSNLWAKTELESH